MELEEYLESNNFDRRYYKLKKQLKNKKIIIYGAGQMFEYIDIEYRLDDFNIIGISDGKYIERDKDELFRGYRKILPQDIMNFKPDILLVSVLRYQEAIKSLKERNLIDKNLKVIPLVKKYSDISDVFYNFFTKKRNIEFKSALYQQKLDFTKMQRTIATASVLHPQTFGEFKNKFQGRDVVLLGAGPTLNYFNPIKDAIYVGCNRTFLYDKVKLDFLFASDKTGIEQFEDEFVKYKGNNCVKFIGDLDSTEYFQIPQSLVYKANARKYKILSGAGRSFIADIDTQPLFPLYTITLQAIQFILYTNPKRIYIVGVDCSAGSKGYFAGTAKNPEYRNQVAVELDRSQAKQWFKLKNFVKAYYPETEIVSVNPVALKGYFNDVYTQEYIDKNPHLFKGVDMSQIELLGK